jgi:hypothetical protein
MINASKMQEANPALKDIALTKTLQSVMLLFGIVIARVAELLMRR